MWTLPCTTSISIVGSWYGCMHVMSYKVPVLPLLPPLGIIRVGTVVGVHTHSFKTYQCDSSSSMKPVEILSVSTPRAKHLYGCISHHQQIQVPSLYVRVFIHGPHQPQSRATFLQFFCFASPPTPVSSPYGLSSLYLHDNPIYREITKHPGTSSGQHLAHC